MGRHVHSASNNLDWTIRRLWLLDGLRPVGLRELDARARQPLLFTAWTFLFSPLFSVIAAIPTMIVILPLRFAGLASWEVRAQARPWGRRGPPEIVRWRVKGWHESAQAVEDVAAALERGERQPQIAGAVRVD
ncbi:MAG: hypothetical protein JWM06_1612 [Actinomycetia bacterium]|nr:hypothetical protein [Actinomycetes bacterium]